ncbi:MAG: hypothetical protein AAFY98_00755 [Verrucomicrobiota bacterium]
MFYRKYTSLTVVMLLLATQAAMSQTTVTNILDGNGQAVGSRVDVDLEDVIAGTLVGDKVVGNDSTVTSHQPFADLGDPGTATETFFEIGFTINVTGGIGLGALYDTDRREYSDDNFATTTTDYDDVQAAIALNGGVIDSSIRANPGDASAGEDPDLEIDTGPLENGEEVWELGNLDTAIGPDGNLAFPDGLATRFGNTLIIQEGPVSNNDQRDGGLQNIQGNQGDNNGNRAPDDNSGGGTITLDFEADLTRLSFVWIDLDNSNNVTITFSDLVDANGDSIAGSVEFEFATFEDGGAFDVDAGFGDESADYVNLDIDDLNTAVTLAPSDGDLTATGVTQTIGGFREVSFDLGGKSGSIGAIGFDTRLVAIPEPSTIVSGFLLVSLGAFACVRRWRSRNDST